MKFWKHESFKTLQKDWYERLKSEGFYDIEALSNDDVVLRRYAGAFANYLKRKYVTRLVTEEYFQLLIAGFYKETRFKKDVDALIMQWFADGERITTICQRLSQLGIRRARNTVRFIIRRYEMRWGIKEYTRRQRNLREDIK